MEQKKRRLKINNITALEAKDINIPNSIEQANKSIYRDQWKHAREKEIESMMKNEVWEEVERPPGIQVLRLMWLFNLKSNDGKVERFKARLVALGNRQEESSFDKTRSPVAKQVTLRILLHEAASKGLHLRQADFTTAYLNAPIDHDIYIQVPDMDVKPGKVLK